MRRLQARLAGVTFLALAALTAVASAQTQSIAFNSNPQYAPGFEPNFAAQDGLVGYTAGWLFTVNSSTPLIVTKLGSDATNIGDTPVAMYDMTTGALLCSAIVSANSTDVATNSGGFASKYVTLAGPAVTLTQGDTYYVGALLQAGTRDWLTDTSSVTDPAITYANAAYAPPGGDGMTPQPAVTQESATYGGDANFQFMPKPTLIPGDINGDGLVDVADYNIWAANVGKTGATWADGDLNGDGLVDVADYNIWAANVGKTSATPEPISMIILAIGGGIVALKRSRA
jgi:hypothetical protein